jgi:hypothetical protein
MHKMHINKIIAPQEILYLVLVSHGIQKFHIPTFNYFIHLLA